MPDKRPVIVSIILTILILFFFAILSLLFEMVALNAVSERQGLTAMGISLVCQGIVIVLAAIFARWSTNFMITKFDWNPILAVIAAVTAGTVLGGLASFLSVIISIPLAGVR